ncbi:hypothetical protein CPC08DRAFT_717316 [Agrocybe pediades]|nr:hypothetical protein CPC08DRAFT_717316 [Agrocybe pediades]
MRVTCIAAPAIISALLAFTPGYVMAMPTSSGLQSSQSCSNLCLPNPPPCPSPFFLGGTPGCFTCCNADKA